MVQRTSDRLNFADSILREAIELPASERCRVVRERCGSDSQLGDSLLRLLSKFDQLGDFLEKPAIQAADRANVLMPGATLSGGRFHVISYLGRGGMGEVYHARDLELGVDVALKTVRRLWRAEETADAQFRSEIRLARQISHANVCRIFDLFTDRIAGQDILFFTMEYLEGETLAARIGRGRIAQDQILRWASAIAAGLSAAHKKGIVHRDLKPANVMLAENAQRVVIMDFGLAANLSGEGAVFAEEMIGSPDYMAPEQFLGTASLPATDVYAFGLMVYEMTVGRRPFPTEQLLRLALRRVSQDAPDLRLAAPDAPAAWTKAVNRALSRDPAARYASTEEFIASLRPSADRKLMRRVAVGALAGGAMAVSGFVYRYREQQPVRAPLLMIMPCSYASNDSRMRSQAEIVDVLFRRELAQSAYVKVLLPEQIEAAWRLLGSAGAPDLAAMAPPVARHIALRAARDGQMPFVLFLELAKTGDEQSLLLSLERVGSGPAFPSHAKSWHREIHRAADLQEASFDGARWLREAVGEAAGDVDLRSRRPEELTTPEWQALQEYQLGETAWKQNRTDASILHLKAAVELDPEFAFADAGLADHLLTLGRPDEAYAHWSRAAGLLAKRNLTDKESLSIRGRFALDVGLYTQAEEVFSRYALEFPEDGLALFYKADAVSRQGRVEEAEQLLNRAIRLNPYSLSFLLDRSALYLQASDRDRGERDWRAASLLGHGDWLDLFAAANAFERGEFEMAHGALARLNRDGSRDFQSRGFALLACFRAERGAWSDGRNLLNQGISFDRANGLPRPAIEQKQKLLAELYLRQDQRGEAIRICHGALENVSGLQMQMQLGGILAQAGDLRGARLCMPAAVPGWPVYQIAAKRLEGEIALASGQARRALALMKQAVRPVAMRLWPDHVARAALAAQDYATAGECFRDLLMHPGIYCLRAEQNTAGMLRYATSTARKLNKWPALDGRVKFFRTLLEST